MHLFPLFLMTLVLSSLLSVGSSGTIPPSIARSFINGLSNEWRKHRVDLLQNLFESIQDRAQNSPPSWTPALEKIEGLATIKWYLYEIGYMKSPPPYTDFIDSYFEQALSDFQVFFKLDANGTLDYSTLQLMSRPRCRVPDHISTQNTWQKFSWPDGNNWLNGKKNITYGFLPESRIPTDIMVVIKDAFNRWSNATAMNFTETTEIKVKAPDITIGFYSFDDLFNGTMYGTVLLEVDGQDTVGTIRLDAWKNWVVPSANDNFTWQSGEVDLETVVMHHIGHLVGLPHSSAEEAVMYPYILPSRNRKVQLSNDDKERLQKLNASSGDSERNAVTAVLSSLFVGLACMVLLI